MAPLFSCEHGLPSRGTRSVRPVKAEGSGFEEACLDRWHRVIQEAQQLADLAVGRLRRCYRARTRLAGRSMRSSGMAIRASPGGIDGSGEVRITEMHGVLHGQ